MKKFLSIITVTCVLTSMLIVSAVSAGATGQLVINKKAKAKESSLLFAKYTWNFDF